MKYFLIYLTAINIIAAFVTAIDKFCAKHDLRRVPERVLIMMAVLGGSFGELVSMYVFRHKTRKPKFKYGVPFILFAQAALIVLYVMIINGVIKI